MNDQPKTPTESDELTYEEFCKNPQCQRCHDSMRLNDGCEWPEDRRLWICGNCASDGMSEALKELEQAQAELTRKDDLMAQRHSQAGAMLEAAQKRIGELEAERQNWRMSSVCRELRMKLDASEAGAAALRGALENATGALEGLAGQQAMQDDWWVPIHQECEKALSTDCGRSFVTREALEKCRDALEKQVPASDAHLHMKDAALKAANDALKQNP